MRADVISAYTDKNDGAVHLPGEVVELTERRAKELEEGGFVSVHRQRRRAPKKE